MATVVDWHEFHRKNMTKWRDDSDQPSLLDCNQVEQKIADKNPTELDDVSQTQVFLHCTTCDSCREKYFDQN